MKSYKGYQQHLVEQVKNSEIHDMLVATGEVGKHSKAYEPRVFNIKDKLTNADFIKLIKSTFDGVDKVTAIPPPNIKSRTNTIFNFNWEGVDYSVTLAGEVKGRGSKQTEEQEVSWLLVLSAYYDDGTITDFDSLKEAITPNTKAIMLVHGLGFNGINDEIIQIAKENDIMLLEDICESHGAEYKNQRVGSFGDISCYSFYFGHHMTTIEGGVICTNNEEIYQLARMFRSHGMTREASKSLQEKYSSPELNPLFTFAVPGFNVRSTELNAVLGLEQLKRLDSHINTRRENFDLWLSNLNSTLYYTNFKVEGNSNFALPLILKTNNLDKVCSVLDKEKIEYRLGTIGGGNQARQPYVKNSTHRIVGNLKNSDYIHENSLYVGNHPELKAEQIINLCKKLNNV